jgi:hypothetical protein
VKGFLLDTNIISETMKGRPNGRVISFLSKLDESIPMPKNPVQFQKGLALYGFMDEYGTEEPCREALFRLRWPNGFVCPECGGTSYCELKSRRLYQCHTWTQGGRVHSYDTSWTKSNSGHTSVSRDINLIN